MANSHEHRRQLMKKYSRLYRKATGLDPTVCAYCGFTRQALDHVPPVSLLEGIDTKEYIKKGGTFTLYPTCNQCNTLLKTSSRVSFYERLELLSIKYDKKLNNLEVWSESELKEMGRTMRAYIEAHQYKIQIIIQKMAMIDSKMLNDEYDDFK